MTFRRLKDYDFDVLESYWLRFQDLSNTEDEKQKAQAEIIKQVIEKQYNGSDGLLRKFIEVRYFGSAATDTEAMHEAEEKHGISKVKFKRIREILLKETAELIGWV